MATNNNRRRSFTEMAKDQVFRARDIVMDNILRPTVVSTAYDDFKKDLEFAKGTNQYKEYRRFEQMIPEYNNRRKNANNNQMKAEQAPSPTDERPRLFEKQLSETERRDSLTEERPGQTAADIETNTFNPGQMIDHRQSFGIENSKLNKAADSVVNAMDFPDTSIILT
ncbi:hypothetical protein Ddc_01436 [Ditylenchus destructor]|nr:hypothetical protein Ddc_01436 [Ditylenchus destructor]